VASVSGVEIFIKRYYSAEHFEPEIKALDALRSQAASTFYIDYLAHDPKSFSIAFPLCDGDLSAHWVRSGVAPQELEALCRLITTEMRQMQKLQDLHTWLRQGGRLRGDHPFFYLRWISRLQGDWGIRPPALLWDNPHLCEAQTLMRYDPQLENFILWNGELYSNDLAMFRINHKCYPFGYIVHNLVEHPRPNLRAESIQAFFESFLGRHAAFFLPPETTARQMILLCRAEALAYSVDWHLRRGQGDRARLRWSRLNAVLGELHESC